MDYEVFIDGREPVLKNYFQYLTTIPADDYPEAFGKVYSHLLLKLGIDSDCIQNIKIHSVPSTTKCSYGG